jgi:molybdenum cofactor biosynthesis enzyme MoaA
VAFGGEPTLRHDASEIIDLFVQNNGVRRLIIPTNGLVKERVYAIVDAALGSHSIFATVSERRTGWVR